MFGSAIHHFIVLLTKVVAYTTKIITRTVLWTDCLEEHSDRQSSRDRNSSDCRGSTVFFTLCLIVHELNRTNYRWVLRLFHRIFPLHPTQEGEHGLFRNETHAYQTFLAPTALFAVHVQRSTAHQHLHRSSAAPRQG